MKFFNQLPLFRILTPLLIGIIVGAFFHFPFSWEIVLVSCIIATILIGKTKIIYIKYSFRWIYGLVLLVALFGIGFSITIGNIEQYKNTYFGTYSTPNSWYQIRIIEPIQEKEKTYKILAEVETVINDTSFHKTTGKIIFYFQKNEEIAHCEYGDMLLVNAQFNEIDFPKNPEEFNYKRYLSFHNIYHQSYVPIGNYIKLKQTKTYFLFELANKMRQRLLAIFHTFGINGEEYGVASALVLGFKGALDKELMRAYASAGATHVLAVSGLHVGIIFVVLNAMLFFIDKLKNGAVIKAILLIGFLWFYALLTGLSPSVLRATTMFSFLAIGRATKLNTNIYNTLAASALLLLLLNPFLVMEVGFQLSYLAVIGIVYLHPKIYGWWEFDNWLLDKIWTLTAISISAQIATFPLGLLYFHQFPNYFFLSNLIVIPFATGIVYLGIGLFITSFISDFLAQGVAFTLDWVIWIMNFFVKKIDGIPYALTEGIAINITETWMLYLLILLALAFLALQRIKLLYLSLSMLVVLLSFQLYEGVEHAKQHKLIVYSVPKTSAVELIDGNKSTLLSHQPFIEDEAQLLFYVKHNWWEKDVKFPQLDSLSNPNFKSEVIEKLNHHIFQYKNNRFAIINELNEKHITPLKIDYLILSHLQFLDWKMLQTNYDFKQLIIDSSHKKWQAKKWSKEAEKQGISAHFVSLEGAFIVDL